MRDITRMRLQLLANGYVPILNRCKVPALTGWQTMTIDEETVRSWDRSTHPSTGLRVERGMAVIDVDVDRGDLVNELARRIEAEGIMPGLFGNCLVRRSAGAKEAWFMRTDAPFSRIRSTSFVEPGTDPTDADKVYFVEAFGGGSARQFGCFGAHKLDDHDNVLSLYSWEGDMSPATVPLSTLPAWPVTAFARVCDLFDEVATAAGLTPAATAQCIDDPTTLYTLNLDTRVDMADGTTMTIADLETAAPRLHSGEEYLRCSGSFHDATRVRRDSHAIAIGRHGIGIYDFMTGITYCRVDREPPPPLELAKVLQQLGEGENVAPPPQIRRARPLPELEAGQSRETAHLTAVRWLQEERAVCPSAFMGRGGIMPIYPGSYADPVTASALRMTMRPYDYIEIGPRGGEKRISPVDAWLELRERVAVDGIRMRPDMPSPLFTEGANRYINAYAPPQHPTEGGTVRPFFEFLERLIPDITERNWFLYWLAHKVQHPEVPMVTVVMVADNQIQGTGRGSLGDIITKLLGEAWVKNCGFDMITGASPSARFNIEFAFSLMVLVDEAATPEDDGRYSSRHSRYEMLKAVTDPNGERQMRFEAKGQTAVQARPTRSILLSTNHRDAILLPKEDRRFAVLSNIGKEMTWEERVAIRNWMAVPENIGALYRTLNAMKMPSHEVFDPYMAPKFNQKLDMIELAKTDLDRAYEAALENLRGQLFTMTQMLTLMRYHGEMTGADWMTKARRMIRRKAYALRRTTDANYRIRVGGRREVIYALDKVTAAAFAERDVAAALAATENGLPTRHETFPIIRTQEDKPVSAQ